jgi:hypothetical protein
VNADELWRALARTDELPVEAIESSLAHWDEVSDRYLAKLRALVSGARLTDADLDALFVAIHMFAEKRDQRAYAPLCAELAKDRDSASRLGDAASQTLPSLLISLFDGDPSPLHMVAEAPDAEVESRCAAIEALGCLTRVEPAIPEEATRAWFVNFGKMLTDADDPLLGGSWALVVAALGYDDLAPEIARAISRGAVNSEFYTIKNFHADLREARADPSGLAVFLREDIKPFGSTVETLARRYWTDHDEEKDDDGGSPSSVLARDEPHLNPLRDVGRNDPCPCGSGKKYKKCCLAA